MSNKIILICGPSGSGKTTVANLLESEYGRESTQSATDRPPRYKGETGHTFVSSQWFEDNKEDIISYVFYNGHQYGITPDLLKDVFVVDPIGVKCLKERYKGDKRIVVVGLDCPREILVERMRSRGDSEEKIKSRLDCDEKAFYNFIELCDVVIDSCSLTPDEMAKTVELLF